MKLVILVIYAISLSNCEVNSTLKLVQVYFRHGSRAPTKTEVYPLDLHIHFWRKVGFAQLTNVGKEQSKQLGRIIRRRYDSFLPKSYNSEEIVTKSTDYDRTRQTARLVLEGIFSTSSDNNSYAFLYKNHSDDFELRSPYKFCNAYNNERNRVSKLTHFQELIDNYKDLFDLLSEKTNKPFNTLLDAFFLFQLFYSEKYINLTIPKWADSNYETMKKIAATQFHLENYNSKLKRLNGGRTLKTVIKNMKAAFTTNKKKMLLNSVHDTDVVNILAAMGLFKPHFPNYNSATILELHQNITSKLYQVKSYHPPSPWLLLWYNLSKALFLIAICYLLNAIIIIISFIIMALLTIFYHVVYVRHVNEEPEEMILKECGTPCQFTKFEEIMTPYLPKNYTQECESSVLLDTDDLVSLQSKK